MENIAIFECACLASTTTILHRCHYHDETDDAPASGQCGPSVRGPALDHIPRNQDQEWSIVGRSDNGERCVDRLRHPLTLAFSLDGSRRLCGEK